MSKTVIKIREGESVPDGARYLHTSIEHDEDNAYARWQPTPGIMGMLPIFGTETLYKITPTATFHYYEITESSGETDEEVE